MRETNWVFSAADVERAQLEDCSASDEHCLHEGRDHYAEQVLSLGSAQRALLGRAYTDTSDTRTLPPRGEGPLCGAGLVAGLSTAGPAR